MRKPVGLGIIGAGARTRAVLAKVLERGGEDVRVVSLFDPDMRSVENTLDVFGRDIRVCDSVDAVVTDSAVSWVFVGSLNCHHAFHVISALEAGKDVFCEKPLATKLEDCLAVREAVKRTGRKLIFGLVLRYSPHYQRIHELVESGAIGDLISFEFNETLNFNHGGYIFGNWRRSRALAGTHILEKCCHDLDLANWLVDSKPQRVASFGGRNFFHSENANHVSRLGPDENGRDAYHVWTDHHSVNPFNGDADIVDNQVAIIEYASGVRATFHTNCNTALSERRFYLCGSEGTLRADALLGTIEIKRIGHNSVLETVSTGSIDSHSGGDDVMAQGILDTMLKDVPPLATVDDGINAFAVAHGIDQALDDGRVVNMSDLWKRIQASQAASESLVDDSRLSVHV